MRLFISVLIFGMGLTACESVSVRRELVHGQALKEKSLKDVAEKLKAQGWTERTALSCGGISEDKICLYREKEYRGKKKKRVVSGFVAQVERDRDARESMRVTVKSTLYAQKKLTEDAEVFAKEIKTVIAEE